MSMTKRFIEATSVEMGYGGEINDDVLAEVSMKMRTSEPDSPEVQPHEDFNDKIDYETGKWII